MDEAMAETNDGMLVKARNIAAPKVMSIILLGLVGLAALFAIVP